MMEKSNSGRHIGDMTPGNSNSYLFRRESVWQNIEYPLKIRKVNKQERRKSYRILLNV